MEKPPSPSTTLDLHGVRHADVEDMVKNFVLQYQDHMPLEIIYGNSTTMRHLVLNSLETLEVLYNSGHKNQYGRFLLMGWKKDSI